MQRWPGSILLDELTSLGMQNSLNWVICLFLTHESFAPTGQAGVFEYLFANNIGPLWGPVTSHDSRFTIHVSRFTFHGSRVTVHGSRFTGHGSRITDHRSRVTDHGSRVTPDVSCRTIDY